MGRCSGSRISVWGGREGRVPISSSIPVICLVYLSQGGSQAFWEGVQVSRLGPGICQRGTGTTARAHPTSSAALCPAVTSAWRAPLNSQRRDESQHWCCKIHCWIIEWDPLCISKYILYNVHQPPDVHVCMTQSSDPVLMLLQRVWEMGYYKCGVWNTDATSCCTHRKEYSYSDCFPASS